MLERIMAAVAGVGTLAIVGCTPDGPPHPQQHRNHPDTMDALGLDVGAAELKDVVLKDGTRCVVLVGPYKASITCDWQGPKQQMELAK